MKKTILLIIVVQIVATIISTNAQNLNALDEKNGFRDMKFGMDINKFQNMELTKAYGPDSSTKYYIKTDDKMQIGNYDVNKISYEFYKNKLRRVIIQVNGWTNRSGILKVMEAMYGDGSKGQVHNSTYDYSSYTWKGQKVNAVYKMQSASENAELVFFSVPITNKMLADEKEAQRKKTKGDM